jgi:hypothetical protein
VVACPFSLSADPALIAATLLATRRDDYPTDRRRRPPDDEPRLTAESGHPVRIPLSIPLGQRRLCRVDNEARYPNVETGVSSLTPDRGISQCHRESVIDGRRQLPPT